MNHGQATPMLKRLILALLATLSLASSAHATPPPTLPGQFALWKFNEGSGGLVKNYFAAVAQTGVNKIPAPEQAFGETKFWTKNLCTVTEAAGNNQDGVPVATRFQITTGGYIGSSLTGLANDGQNTLSCWLKSNTGSSQNACLMFHTTTETGPLANNITITTSWARYSITTSYATGLLRLPFLHAPSGNLDVLCGGFQLEAGASASTYVAPDFDFFLPLNGSDSPTWTAEGVTADATDTGIAKGRTYPTFAEQSGYMCLRIDSASSDRISIRDILSSPARAPGFAGGTINSQGANRQGIVVASGTLLTISPIVDSKYHVLAWTWDGATLKYYLDGTYLKEVAASTGWTSTGFYLGDITTPLVGKRGPHAIYTEAHTAAEVREMTAWIASEMAARSVTVNDLQTLIAFEGDSISEIFGAWAGYSYTFRTLQGLTPVQMGVTNAVSGSTFYIAPNITTRTAALDAMLTPNKAYPLLSVFTGTNDIASGRTAQQTFDALKAYCQARKAAGWNRIMVWTCLPRNVMGFEATRLSYNTLIRNASAEGWYDYLCDVGADPDIGDDDNFATFYIDGIHPNEDGQDILLTYATDGIEAMLAMPPAVYPSGGVRPGVIGGGFNGPGKFNFQIPDAELDAFRITLQPADRQRHYALAL